MDKKIPLFPLKLVLFPRSKYPLHIFEERYKKMIARCLKENENFGITSQFNTEISNIGTLAAVDSVTRIYDTGEMDIIVKAVERIEIDGLEIHPDGYYICYAKRFDDLQTGCDPELHTRLIDILKSLLNKLDFRISEPFWEALSTAELKSFKIAEKAGLSLEQQQLLISMQDENARSLYLLNHLNKLYDSIDESPIYKNLFLNDGYVNV